AAAVSATARDAGPTGLTLLGGLATIMWDKYGSLGPGTQAMDGTGYGQHGAAVLQRRSRTPRNPANTAAPGRCRTDKPSRRMMLERAKQLLQPSARSAVPPFMVMDVMAAAARLEARGRRIIHMEVGQPAAAAPATAIAAARTALSSGRLGYTEALGIASLRRRIARSYAEWHGLDVDPARIVVTTGSSGGFILAFLAAFEAGDRVATALPGYPPYRHILTALGCEPVGIETTAETRWALTGEALMARHRLSPLKGVVVGSPANPSGTMTTAPALAELIRCAEDAGIIVISDEIYHGLD